MLRRLHFAVLAAVGVSILPATVQAQRSPSFATPTTTTTTPVIVTPTTTTTTPVIVTPTTTTAAPVIVTPTPATTAPAIVAPSTTTRLDDLVQATVAPDGDVLLGAIDTGGAVPEGPDITAFPGRATATICAARGTRRHSTTWTSM